MSNISEILEQEEEMSLSREDGGRGNIKNISKLNDKNWNRLSYFQKIKYLEKIKKILFLIKLIRLMEKKEISGTALFLSDQKSIEQKLILNIKDL